MNTQKWGNVARTAMFFVIIGTLSACSSLQGTQPLRSTVLPSKQNANSSSSDGIYVAMEYPVSLHPAIASGLCLPNEKEKALGYDRDLLGLGSSISKMFTRQLTTDASIGAGVVEAGGQTKRFRTTFDTIQYASYPMEIEVPVNIPDGCLYNKEVECEVRTINIIPLIGAGVRVMAEYNSDAYEGNLSLTYLSAKASASNIKGTVQLQLLGVNRLGPNASGITQLNLTPDSIAMIQQQIAAIMSEMWYKDTIIQPQIVGYTILGAPNLSLVSQSDIIDQILKNVHSLSNNFFETLLQESIKNGDVNPEDADFMRRQYQTRLVEMTRYNENELICEFARSRLTSRPGVDSLSENAKQRVMVALLDHLTGKTVKDLDTAELDKKIDSLVRKEKEAPKLAENRSEDVVKK